MDSPLPSLIVRFYRDGEADVHGRTLLELQQLNDWAFEMCHDHIQWLFPLHEESSYRECEVLTEGDVKQLRDSASAKANMNVSLARFRLFLGLPSAPGEPFEQSKVSQWCTPYNHNLLRITRVIRSARLFGLEAEALTFYADVRSVAREDRVGATTLRYWKKAAEDDPMAPLNDVVNRGPGEGGNCRQS
jgi:hypothetical protein